MVNDYADFNTLKELLGVTDGNLASHTKALEKENYIKVEKRFIGRKPNTRYSATKLGKSAFEKHIDAIEKLIGKLKFLSIYFAIQSTFKFKAWKQKNRKSEAGSKHPSQLKCSWSDLFS